MKLSELEAGEVVTVSAIGNSDMTQTIKRKLLSMGITPKSKITLIRRAPLGSGLEIEVRGSRLCVRSELADAIEVTK
ncbi:ferrous iron transport protein A [Parashewanella curva]|uniref:Ferrous iron transport protein A n=1 Tax=Parashewanella curva TaxID=2338552 RepID=A0A3L8PTJ4_9GAMM|nr:FeoA family protein [Parashewanella curva]RLV57728.1 ferrous iron transport protein A [Parashewanella curva]